MRSIVFLPSSKSFRPTMACSSSSSAPSYSLALTCLLVLCMHVPSSSSVSFSFNFSNTSTAAGDDDDPCGQELTCYHDAHFDKTTSAMELTKNLRGAITDSQGRVWYKHPVPVWKASTGEVASFTTTFSFNLTSSDSNSCMETWASQTGDGMAFFLAPWPTTTGVGGGVILPNATAAEGGDLYLFNPSNHFNATGDDRVVAVEFDTFYNDGWDNTSKEHIGIDVNSIVSVAFTETPGVNSSLTSPFTKVAMISYDNVTKKLAVDVQINDGRYHVDATVNLTQSLPETVAVGFSASTADCVELHQLLSWSFNSTLQLQESSKLPVEVASAGGPGAAAAIVSIRPEPSAKLLLEVLFPTGSVLAVCAAAVVGLLLWRTNRHRPRQERAVDSKESDEQNNGEAAAFEMSVTGAGPRRYYYRDLAVATGGFAEENLLGRGGFGSVYRGWIPASGGCCNEDGEDGEAGQQRQRRRQEVAIKKFNSESSCQSRKEFEAEVKIIGRLRHRNIVQLLGWCDSRRGLLLVYELVPHGSLDKHIYTTHDQVLNWPQRYNIILGLASALHYIHRDWDQRVVHGDIKPSNIMLDSSYSAKLGDFGLARLGEHGAGPQTTDLVKGTMGYIDPEFVNTHRRSTESDIYSFGVVLLEIVSGRSPVEYDRQEPPFSLLKWVETLYCCRERGGGGGVVLDAVDPRLRRGDGDGDASDDQQMERVLIVGLWCAHRDPGQRPTIAEALQALQQPQMEMKLMLPALSSHMMHGKLATPPSAGMVASTTGVNDSGVVVSGNSFSSGVRSTETAGTTAGCSSEESSFAGLPSHSTW